MLLNLVLKSFYSAFCKAHGYKPILAKFSPPSGCVL